MASRAVFMSEGSSEWRHRTPRIHLEEHSCVCVKIHTRNVKVWEQSNNLENKLWENIAPDFKICYAAV